MTASCCAVSDGFVVIVGLFTNVSSGVKDVFYEPIYGVVHGTTDLPAGLAKGAASFVKKTVFGLSDTVTKVTGSIGKGMRYCPYLSLVLTNLQVFPLQHSTRTSKSRGG